MALQGTTANFAKLFAELSDYKGDDLYIHAEALIKWQAISEIAEMETEETDTADSVYDDILGHHSNMMWKFVPHGNAPTFSPTLSQRAFVLALTSIELARADAQGKAVTVLLDEIDEFLYGKRDVSDDVERIFMQLAIHHQRASRTNMPFNEALAEAKSKVQTRLNALHKSGQSNFYIDMISKLGSRLDPVNQGAVLAWVVKNGMVDHSDLSNDIQFAAEIADPDSYSRHYSREAQAEAGETLLEIFTQRGADVGYSNEYRGWTTALLLKDHQRFVGTIELPNVEDDGTTYYSVWVNPLNDKMSRVFLVDEERYDNSKMIHGLVSSFSEAAKASTSDEQRARFRKGQGDLAALLIRKLQSEKCPYDIDFALNEAGAYTLSHLNNG